MPDLRLTFRAISLVLALSSSALHAETFTLDLGAALKEGIKNALQGNADSSSSAETGNYLVPGHYDASDRNFERSLTIHPGGKFELEVMEKGSAANLHSGSGSGQLVFKAGQWQYTEGICTMMLAPAPSAVQVHLQSCASTFGDVPFDGRYRLKGKQTANASTATAANKNKKLAAQLNCQKLNLGNHGVGDLLANATRQPQSQIWNHEIVVPGSYTFGGLPIQSVNLSEVDGGFLALFVEGDALAIKSAIKKAHLAGDSTVVMLRKVGEANGYAFPGKPAGQPYVQCTVKGTESGMD
ncbi:hypothetical protein [Paludibacterium purpuratum]|uniref:Uncharacterized protein n=1 Tax=Paludibacterium purpuratum TaxID=1144873 RepID=A0A4R7BD84_9NEIS|nr:hypothetical protein [Paludibacterium purpuratum]TDR81915.1 hypothetical protein DFP86_10225 [Paludibacterium purpuratum]